MATGTILVYLAFVVVLQAPRYAMADYCPFYSNISDSSHTSCLSRTNTGGLSDADKATVLNMHNAERGSVTPAATNMLKMRYDTDLEDLAYRWAENCVWGHDDNNNRNMYGKIGSVGQNMYMTTGSANTTAAIQSWADEQNFFDYNIYPSPTQSGKVIGHYTQIIWADTYLVGCGWAYCSNLGANLFVCNYGPGGNMYGEMPYKNGSTSASDCPDTQEGNLCNCPTAYCENSAKVNVANCGCSCNSRFQSGANCSFDCSVSDHSYCATGWSDPSNCASPSIKFKYCANQCNACPTVANVP